MKKLGIFLFILTSSLLITACQTDDLSKDIDEHDQKELDERTKDDDIAQTETDSDNEDNAPQEEEDNVDQEDSNHDDSGQEQEEVDKHITQVEEGTGLHIVDNPESTEVYVNKQRKLPEGYTPPDLVEPNVAHFAKEGNPKRQLREIAANALESLFTEAEKQGVNLIAVSGYRSYSRQKTIYENNVATKGQEQADKYSAKPGTSEHQTGLAMDVGSANETTATLLEESFKQTDEGAWLAENAHNFGFIIRYPEGKSDITGYNYEPWHIRYIGEEIATEIYNKDITLEEYFGYDY